MDPRRKLHGKTSERSADFSGTCGSARIHVGTNERLNFVRSPICHCNAIGGWIVGTRVCQFSIGSFHDRFFISTAFSRAASEAVVFMASPEEIALQEALQKGSSDLKFILTRNDVADDLQAAFYKNEVTTIQKFSSFFRTEEDLVEVLKESFGTDSGTSLRSRAQVAAVICAWRETQTKQRRQMEVEAEMDTREWTKPIATGDYINMRNAYMKVYGRLEDKVTPSKEYLEKKLQELENGEFRAETMAEVVSKDEVDPDVMVPIFDSKGSLTVKKGATTIPLPTGPEQLRRRLTVMVNAILMLAIKHTNREEIQDVTRDIFERYKDYVLGDYVWGLSSTDLHGNQVQTPPWTLVPSYEQAIRKKAYSLMVTDGLKLGAALEEAWKCPTTKERHFITPLALYSKRSYPQQSWGEWSPKGKGKTGKSAGHKGKAKGKGVGTTPDGAKICFRFNQGKCSYQKCKFSHVCNRCFKKGHNALNCKEEKHPPDTTGAH